MVEVVVKLANPDPPGFTFGHLSLAYELPGAMLARASGLSVPDYMIVDINLEFATAVPRSMNRLFSSNIGLHFGGTYYPGIGEFVPGTRVTSQVELQDLENILSFDAMILNTDRHELKPNLLQSATEYLLIDHSTILPLHIPPSQTHLTHYQISEHLLFRTLTRKNRQYVSHVGQWNSALSPIDIWELLACVPDEWATPFEHYQTMKRFLSDRRMDGPEVTALLKEVVQ